MINVLFISHTTDFSGAERSLYDLIAAMDKTKYSIFVCCPTFGNQVLLEQLKGLNSVKIIQFNYKQVFLIEKKIFRHIANLIYQIFTTVKFIKILKKNSIAIVFTNTAVICVGGLAAKICGIPHVWWLRESIRNNINGRFIFGNNIYEQLMGALSECLVFNSEWTSKQYDWLNKEKFRVIYNGFEFPPILSPSKNNLSIGKESEITLGVVGTISANKGQLQAIEALKLLLEKGYKVRLYIYGVFSNKEYKTKIETIINSNSLTDNVVIRSEVFDIRGLFSKFDILLVPSQVESFGRVVVEGMYFSKIVIANEVGGIPEIITNRINGILIRNNSGESLAHAIAEVVESADLQNSVKRYAKIRACDFSNLEMAKKTQDLIDDIMQGKYSTQNG